MEVAAATAATDSVPLWVPPEATSGARTKRGTRKSESDVRSTIVSTAQVAKPAAMYERWKSLAPRPSRITAQVWQDDACSTRLDASASSCLAEAASAGRTWVSVSNFSTTRSSIGPLPQPAVLSNSGLQLAGVQPYISDPGVVSTSPVSSHVLRPERIIGHPPYNWSLAPSRS